MIFCRYGYCLEEETAKEYLKFLVNGIKNITNRHKTISADTAHKINNTRFRKERERGNRIDDDYFESFGIIPLRTFHQSKPFLECFK